MAHLSVKLAERLPLYPVGGKPERQHQNIHQHSCYICCSAVSGMVRHGSLWRGEVSMDYTYQFTDISEPTSQNRRSVSQEKYHKPVFFLSLLLTFHLVGFAWIFFRSPDFTTATQYISAIFDISNFGFSSTPIIRTTLFYMALVLAIDIPLYRYNREFLVTSETPWPWQSVVYALLILSISFIGVTYVQPFIYFRF